MQMSGEYRIEASRDAVWAALNDPEVLKLAIPGCEEIDKFSDTEFAAKVKIKLGPVSAKFTGNVTLSDLDPPNGYTIRGQGKGGPAGFAKGGAKVRLEADGAATILSYDVDAQVGGKLAQIGSRLIDATAKKLAGDFFARFAEVVEDAEPAETPGPAGASAEATAATPSPTPTGGVRPIYWTLGLIAAVAILLTIFAR